MSRACCNPAHLEPVTSGQNVLRGNGYAARNARKDTCVNGHEFTTDNTIQRPGGRGCRRCANAACVRHRKGNPDYRRRNRERNRRRVTCECGVETSAGNLAKHRRICRDSPEQE
jgi:hypothetical protein